MNFKSEKLHDTICFALMRFTEKTLNIIWFAPSLNKRVSLHYANKNPPEITISCRASTLSPRAGGQSLAALSARQLTQLSCFHNAVKVILLRLSEPCCHAKLIGGYSSTSKAADVYFLIVGT